MPHFQHVRVYTYSGRVRYCQEDPSDLPTAGYSLIDVKPTSDGQNFSQITARFVYGTQDGEYVECVFTKDLLNCLNKRLKCAKGESLMDCIVSYATQIEDEVYQISEVTPVCGENTTQRLLNIFAIGLGSYLGYLCLLNNDQVLQYQPLPFSLRLPENLIGLDLLHPAMYTYLEPTIQVVMTINDRDLGQLWLEQIVNFWNVWGSLFINDSTQIHAPDGLHEAMKGLATHIGIVTGSLQKQYCDLNDELEKALIKITCCRDEAISACRLQKQGYTLSLAKERDNILAEVNDKFAQWDNAVCAALQNLQTIQSNMTTTEELIGIRDQAICSIEDLRTHTAEEICKIREDCLNLMEEHAQQHKYRREQDNWNDFFHTMANDCRLSDLINKQVQAQIYPIQCKLDDVESLSREEVQEMINNSQRNNVSKQQVQEMINSSRQQVQEMINNSQRNNVSKQQVQEMINNSQRNNVSKQQVQEMINNSQRNNVSKQQVQEMISVSRREDKEISDLREEVRILRGMIERLMNCIRIR
jgi:DNA-binding transcriptional regulator YhcF (GntR family)